MGSAIANYAAQLAAADRGFRAVFAAQLELSQAEYRAWLSSLSMEIPTNKKSETHAWLGSSPQLVEWVGERQIARLRAHGFQISNKKWATGIEVDGDDVETDTLGLYGPAIRNLADESIRHKFSLLVDLLNGAFTGLCYDGSAMCADAHPRDSGGTFDNKTDDVLDQAAYQAAFTRMRAVTNHAGRKMLIKPTHLIVGEDLEWIAREILQQERLSTGETNLTKDTAKLMVVPGITSGYWFLADLSRPIKPFITQVKRKERFTAMNSPTSDNVFRLDKHFWGVDWKGNAGYGLCELLQGSDGTGT